MQNFFQVSIEPSRSPLHEKGEVSSQYIAAFSTAVRFIHALKVSVQLISHFFSASTACGAGSAQTTRKAIILLPIRVWNRQEAHKRDFGRPHRFLRFRESVPSRRLYSNNYPGFLVPLLKSRESTTMTTVRNVRILKARCWGTHFTSTIEETRWSLVGRNSVLLWLWISFREVAFE